MPYLWTEKYEPKKMSQLISNRDSIIAIYRWLADFEETRKIKDAKKRKKMKKKASVIVMGGHGIGKTVSVKVLLAKNNYDIYPINFGMIKTKKNIDEVINKMMKSNNIMNMINKVKGKKIAIVIDEVEAITSTKEKSYIKKLLKQNESEWFCPLIFISNGQHNRLLTTIKKCSIEVRFRTPAKASMKRIMENIVKHENINIKEKYVTDKIIEHSQYDIRKLVLELQNIKMTYGEKIVTRNIMDEYCNMIIKKDVDYSIYEAAKELIYNYESVNQSQIYYEMDKVLSPLMVQQNYITSILDKKLSDKLKYKIAMRVAESISKGDVTENYIYGDQKWGMQEIHGFYTCVLTSYYLNEYGRRYPKFQKLIFAWDLNKTSIKNINRKNINNANKCFNNKNVEDYIYIDKIITKLIRERDKDGCKKKLELYGANIDDIDALLKINKIKKNEKIFTTKEKRNFFDFLKI